jgi:hypothetical protein
MRFRVIPSCFICVVICLAMMGVSGVSVVGCMFMLTSSVGFSSLAVVTGCVFVVLSGFIVVFGAFFAHCFRDVRVG